MLWQAVYAVIAALVLGTLVEVLIRIERTSAKLDEMRNDRCRDVPCPDSEKNRSRVSRYITRSACSSRSRRVAHSSDLESAASPLCRACRRTRVCPSTAPNEPSTVFASTAVSLQARGIACDDSTATVLVTLLDFTPQRAVSY